MMKWILAGIFAFSLALGTALYFVGNRSGGEATEVDWRLLDGMDYINHKSTPDIDKVDKTA